MTSIIYGVNKRCDYFCCFSNGNVAASEIKHEMRDIEESKTLTYYTHTCELSCLIVFEKDTQIITRTQKKCEPELYAHVGRPKAIMTRPIAPVLAPKPAVPAPRPPVVPLRPEIRSEVQVVARKPENHNEFQVVARKPESQKKKLLNKEKCQFGIQCKKHDTFRASHTCDYGEDCAKKAFPDLCRLRHSDDDVKAEICLHKFQIACLNERCGNLHFCYFADCTNFKCTHVHENVDKNFLIVDLFKGPREKVSEDVELFYKTNPKLMIPGASLKQTLKIALSAEFRHGIDCPKKELGIEHQRDLCRFCNKHQ